MAGTKGVEFRGYYAGRERGLALGVGRVHALADPLPLAALGLATPPQSFMYVDPRLLSDLQRRSTTSTHALPAADLLAGDQA